jgi:hypothetical protein
MPVLVAGSAAQAECFGPSHPTPLERKQGLTFLGPRDPEGGGGALHRVPRPLFVFAKNYIWSPKGQRLGNRPAQSHGSKVSRIAIKDDGREQGARAAGLPKRILFGALQPLSSELKAAAFCLTFQQAGGGFCHGTIKITPLPLAMGSNVWAAYRGRRFRCDSPDAVARDGVRLPRRARRLRLVRREWRSRRKNYRYSRTVSENLSRLGYGSQTGRKLLP